MRVKSSKMSCWEFYGTKCKGGYTHFAVGKRQMLSHRYSWMLHFGDIPPAMYVCHHCDNPCCVRPDHLFLGRPIDNSRDMLSKNRQARGSGNGRAAVTEEIVHMIRQKRIEGYTQVEISGAFGLSRTQVRRILSGECWRHLGLADVTDTTLRVCRTRGALNGRAKLTERDVDRVYEMRSTGMLQREIADAFGVVPTTISSILRKKLWKHRA